MSRLSPSLRLSSYGISVDETTSVKRAVSSVVSSIWGKGVLKVSMKKGTRKQANPRFCGPKKINNNLCSSDDLRRYKSKDGLARTGLTGFGSAPTTASGSTLSKLTQSQPVILELRNSGGRNDIGKVCIVLCDIFNMGEGHSQSFSKNKGSSNQANPRFYGPN
ncbi:hypothetical protein Cgig2_016527 [Carnegiea gigantea]|uniref:Uncharacterized protein n=1 Tax=Carnegiea gigantea TaxID=171969 RepID=A0A9Q1JYZ2_9CARY|nr:hypothetical protein Cgig2_016527 [Carnegiea gigantea]